MGGQKGQNGSKSCQRGLWMTPDSMECISILSSFMSEYFLTTKKSKELWISQSDVCIMEQKSYVTQWFDMII